MAPWASPLGGWYDGLHAPAVPAKSRRIAIVLTLGASIQRSVASTVTRCGHECVDMNDEPDLIIATWWQDRMNTLALPKGVPVAHLWVGGDAHHTTAHSLDVRYNWVVSPWLGRLLKRRLGLTARVIPIAPSLEPRLLRRSPTPSVLVYCPARREQKYCWDEMVEIARRCPTLEFRVLSKGGRPEAENMVHLPRIEYEDMPSVYAGVRLLLRLTPSDGLSLSVMEALGFGRHVVWNWWAPGATHVSSMKEAIEAVRRLVNAAAYAGGVASALEHRAQVDHAMNAAIDEALL
jgi:hypothetical protein